MAPEITAGIQSPASGSTDSFFAGVNTQIGGLPFWSVSGNPPYPGMDTQPLIRPNVNGVAYRQTGRRAKSFLLTAKVDQLSPVNVHNATAAQMRLKGTIVSFRNDYGNLYNNYMVEDVFFPPIYRGRPNPVRITNGVGGTLPNGVATFWMVTLFRMRYALGF